MAGSTAGGAAVAETETGSEGADSGFPYRVAVASR